MTLIEAMQTSDLTITVCCRNRKLHYDKITKEWMLSEERRGLEPGQIEGFVIGFYKDEEKAVNQLIITP
jgi:hypothetical protein